MKLVILESPYAGDVQRNIAYARRCLSHSLGLGEAPMVSHLLFTQVLDDNVAHERVLGIRAGLAWRRLAELRIFYTDLGWSRGMKQTRSMYDNEGLLWTERQIDGTDTID